MYASQHALQCDKSMTPHYRSCSDGVRPQPKGGNPLGCGWQFEVRPARPTQLARMLTVVTSMTVA